MNKLHTDIGSRIATLRLENNLTQAELAEKLDISIKHCSEVERGLSCLSLEKLVMLCAILSTNLDYLVRGVEYKKSEEASVPSFIVAAFNSDNKELQSLLTEYFSLFKKIFEQTPSIR